MLLNKISNIGQSVLTDSVDQYTVNFKDKRNNITGRSICTISI